MSKRTGCTIQPIEPASRTNPQHACTILEYGPDLVATQALGIIGVVLVPGKLLRVEIESIEATAKAANPEIL
jgi:hypothetical protein